MTVSDNFQIIYNIHYHEIVGGDSVALCNSIKNDIDLCAIDPINSNLVLSGDFNLSSTIGKAYSFSDPVPVAITDTKKAPCTGNGKLQDLLLQLTEVEPGLPTRYNSTTDTGTTIDRIFTNLPTYLFPITKWEIDTGCCKEMYQKHLSDHAILSMHVSFKEVCRPEAGKISEVVFRHPKFSIYHELLCHAVKLDSISDPWTRLDYHKAIISASAQYVREYIQDCKDTTPFAICMTLSTIARVVWTQSRQLALNLIEHSELAAEHLEIGDQVISIRPQGIFTEAYEKDKLDLLNKQTTKNY